MVHLVHFLISSRKATIRGQYDEIYVNGGVVNPWFIMLHLWFMTFNSSRGLDSTEEDHTDVHDRRLPFTIHEGV